MFIRNRDVKTMKGGIWLARRLRTPPLLGGTLSPRSHNREKPSAGVSESVANASCPLTRRRQTDIVSGARRTAKARLRSGKVELCTHARRETIHAHMVARRLYRYTVPPLRVKTTTAADFTVSERAMYGT